MGRILAIDYGQKRTGLAVTDPLQINANGLTTLQTAQLESFVIDYVNREGVERIVVGLPRQNSGEYSENMRRITPFVNRLKKVLPNVPVEMVDERFTSVLAHRAMLDAGLKKKDRQNKDEGKDILQVIMGRKIEKRTTAHHFPKHSEK